MVYRGFQRRIRQNQPFKIGFVLFLHGYAPVKADNLSIQTKKLPCRELFIFAILFPQILVGARQQLLHIFKGQRPIRLVKGKQQKFKLFKSVVLTGRLVSKIP